MPEYMVILRVYISHASFCQNKLREIFSRITEIPPE